MNVASSNLFVKVLHSTVNLSMSCLWPWTMPSNSVTVATKTTLRTQNEFDLKHKLENNIVQYWIYSIGWGELVTYFASSIFQSVLVKKDLYGIAPKSIPSPRLWFLIFRALTLLLSNILAFNSKTKRNSNFFLLFVEIIKNIIFCAVIFRDPTKIVRQKIWRHRVLCSWVEKI